MSGTVTHLVFPQVTHVRVIGIGNEFRQDDGAGLAVVRRLSSHAAGSFDIMEHDGEATSLLQAWEGVPAVVLVDAVRSRSAPGTIHCFDVRSAGLPKGARWSSSHSLGLSEAVALAGTLDCLPRVLIIYGIEGESFGLGRGLSSTVDRAASRVVDRLISLYRSR